MSYKPDSAVTWIVVHYSATPIERDYPVSKIDQMHRHRGFKGTGYHYYIRKNGQTEVGRDLSEPGRFEVGAHSKGENSSSIGICYEGGVTSANPNLGFDSRTKEQKIAMEALILTLLDRFPNAIVEGHRDMPGAATQCPGFNAREWWNEVTERRAEEARKPQIPAEVEAVLADAHKPWWQSKQIRAVILSWLAGGYSFWQSADTPTRVALVAVALMGMYIFADRIRKSTLGGRGKQSIGL